MKTSKFERHWNRVKGKKNVIGHSMTMKPRIKGGKLIEGTKVFRVYVSKKMKLYELAKRDMIPALVEGSEVDIVEVGELKALQVDKTAKRRPVDLGISVGNWNITAGSLGMLYLKDGELYAGSNAHVLTEFPEQATVNEKRILQPGAYHGGENADNIVGEYYWHQRVIPIGESGCPVGNGISRILNWFCKLLSNEGRFKYQGIDVNNLDFAVYKPLVEHIPSVADGSLTNEPFIGHLFAGSDTSGIICKVKYIEEAGYTPYYPSTEVSDGDMVKGCSFWCNFQTQVIDSSGAVTVNYGDFNAMFEDIIIVSNDGTIKGGWSGSGWRKIS